MSASEAKRKSLPVEEARANEQRPIEAWVSGRPTPQGSMKAIAVGGRTRMVAMAGKRLLTWRTKIMAAFQLAMHRADHAGFVGTDAPVRVRIELIVPRPYSHVRKDGALRKGAPLMPTTHAGGDLDKHVRAVLDALAGAGVFDDDCRVTTITAWMAYAESEQDTGAFIRVDRDEAKRSERCGS